MHEETAFIFGASPDVSWNLICRLNSHFATAAEPAGSLLGGMARLPPIGFHKKLDDEAHTSGLHLPLRKEQ